jgi:hypothetical protein
VVKGESFTAFVDDAITGVNLRDGFIAAAVPKLIEDAVDDPLHLLRGDLGFKTRVFARALGPSLLAPGEDKKACNCGQGKRKDCSAAHTNLPDAEIIRRNRRPGVK